MSKTDFAVIDYPLFSQDDRGWVVRPIFNAFSDFVEHDDDEGLGDVRNLHIVSMEPGAIRGEHHHKNQLEFLLIMGSSVELVWQLPGDTRKHRRKVDANPPVVLRVAPNVMHAIKNTSEERIYVVCYSKTYGPAPGQDVYKSAGFFGT
jgi:dTDP-4-dehydrorhamnose 3,5-epimerase-like enzyme